MNSIKSKKTKEPIKEPSKFDLHSLDIVAHQREKLQQLFPEVITESGKIDFDRLKLALGEAVDTGKERYGMTWPGKTDCFKTIQKPSMATLVPAREESVNFDTTENLIIEGDNLEVLKLLQKSYLGKVKMIYIDPPYNTGNDFIYPDNYSESLDTYLRYTGQVDKEGRRFSTNTEADGRFHSKWMNMMYPRLFLARNLLREDGVIFISIDDNEHGNLRKLCDEVFGEENFVESIVWNKRIPKNDKGIGDIHEYVLVYLKNSAWEYKFTMPKDGLDDIKEFVDKLKRSGTAIPEAEVQLRRFYDKKGYDRGVTLYNNLDENYRIWGKINVSWPNATTVGPRYDVPHPISGKPVAVPERGWRWKKETFYSLVDYSKPVKRHDETFMCGQIWFDSKETTQPSLIKYLDDVDILLLRSVLSLKSDGGIEVEDLLGAKNIASYPKPTSLLKTLIQSFALQNGDIILDFFAGSGTTAHAALQLNSEDEQQRRYILVQLPELLVPESKEQKPAADFCDSIGKTRSIAEITKERMCRASDNMRKQNPLFTGDTGFRVFKLQSSNFKAWNTDQPKDDAELAKQLTLHVDHLVEGRTQEDVLYELLLKSGFPLDTSIEKLTLASKTVFSIGDGAMLICLEKELTPEVINAMAERKPKRVVCLDAGFANNDQLKTNAVQTMKAKGVTKFQTV
jgi:adenine-specific DNA-methyltransferase